MRGIYVPLTRYALDALEEFAEQEFRDPKAQAALFVTKALRESGKLADPPAANEPKVLMTAAR